MTAAAPDKPWLIVPVKPFAEGKSRLTTELKPLQRAKLSRQLLEHVLKTAAATDLFAAALVVSRDPHVAASAHAHGADLLLESGRALNEALEQARRQALAQNAALILVLPSDLPRLHTTDLHALVQAADARRANSAMVIAPSRDGGTNALLLRPPALIPFAFGSASFARHCLLAQQAGIAPHVVETASLAFDLDSPADLAELYREGAETLEFC